MVQSAFLNGLSRTATAGFNFAVVILLSQGLGPADRGQAGLYGAVMAAALLVAEFAGGGTIPYLQRSHPLGYMLSVYRWWSMLACVLVVGVAGWAKEISWLHVAGLLLAALANCQATVHQHVLLACQQLPWFNRLMLTPAGLMAFGTAICWFAGGLSIDKFLIILIISWLLSSLIGWRQVRKLTTSGIEQQAKPNLRPVFSAGLLNQSTQLLGLINTRLAYWLLPAAALGAFANALALAEALLIIPGAMGQVLYAQLVQNRHGQKHGSLRRSLLWTLPVVAFGAVLLVLLPGSFYRWLLGPVNGAVGPYLLVLAPAMIVYSVYIVLSYWQSAYGRFWINLTAIAAGLSFSLVALLLQKGPQGWLLSTVVGVLAASLVLNAMVGLVLYWWHRKREG